MVQLFSDGIATMCLCSCRREVDQKMSGIHSGADGFVEQIEGWAFLMAVLPRIDSCSPDVAATVRENVQIRTSDTDPRTAKPFLLLFRYEAFYKAILHVCAATLQIVLLYVRT